MVMLEMLEEDALGKDVAWLSKDRSCAGRYGCGGYAAMRYYECDTTLYDGLQFGRVWSGLMGARNHQGHGIGVAE